MEVEVKIYLVKDGFGQEAYASCEDSSSIIQICGMQNSGEEQQYFESEAYHLAGWCEVNGFEYKCITRKYDSDSLWLES